jgi:hypothetical protein
LIYLAARKAPQRFPNPASPDLLPGVARNFQVFDPLDFIAELTQHIPEPRKHLVRYFGWYSNKARGLRAKAASCRAAETDPLQTPNATKARRRWAGALRPEPWSKQKVGDWATIRPLFGDRFLQEVAVYGRADRLCPEAS